MTDNLFLESRSSQLDAETQPTASGSDPIKIDDWWFHTPDFDTKTVAQKWEEIRSIPFDKMGHGALCRIAYVLGKAGAGELWIEREAEWFDAITPKLGRCDASSIANIFWALPILRKGDNCTIPEAFKANLWPAIDSCIDDFSIRDLALTVSGMAPEKLFPRAALWKKICSRGTELFTNKDNEAKSVDIRELVYGFSALGKVMPNEMKHAVFERAESINFSLQQMITLAADMARASDTFPPAFEKKFYTTMHSRWNELSAVDKAQALSAITTFSVLQPLPEEASALLSSVDTNDWWNDPVLIRPSRLGLILRRLFPKAKNADCWNKSSPLTGINPSLKAALKEAGIELFPLEGTHCIAKTSEGSVLLQQAFSDQLVRDADGKIRLIGKLMVSSALIREAYPELPLVHVALEALPKMSPKQLNKYLTRASALDGTHQLIVTPGSVCKLERIKIAELPEKAAWPARERTATPSNRACVPVLG